MIICVISEANENIIKIINKKNATFFSNYLWQLENVSAMQEMSFIKREGVWVGADGTGKIRRGEEGQLVEELDAPERGYRGGSHICH